MQEKKFELPTIGEIKNKIETALPPTKLTGKRIMIATGAIGFAACFAGFAGWGQTPFILGFVFMLLSATGFSLIAKSELDQQV